MRSVSNHVIRMTPRCSAIDPPVILVAVIYQTSYKRKQIAPRLFRTLADLNGHVRHICQVNCLGLAGYLLTKTSALGWAGRPNQSQHLLNHKHVWLLMLIMVEFSLKINGNLVR